MPNRVKIIIENATEFGFARTGEADDFHMDNGGLDPGSRLPPEWIEPGATCDFTLQSPLGGPGPEGHLRYEFEALKLRASINWTDATRQDIYASNTDNPFSVAWTLLDGGIGDLDATVALSDDSNKVVGVEELAGWHRRDVARQGTKDQWGVPFGPRLLIAKFTLKVKDTQSAAAAPARVPAVMPQGVVRPTGGSKAVVGTAFRTWDAPGISPRRKKLLAVLGNRFPQVYVPPGEALGGADPYGKVPYQRMTSWAPGVGTSCTSINGMIEAILRGKGGTWAFAAHTLDAWVPYGANPSKPMPNVGDVYLLYRDIVKDNPTAATDKPHLRHCGFIAYVPQAPGEDWITADGGQNPAGGGAYLNRRPWELRLPSQTNTGAKQGTWKSTLNAHPFAQPIQDTPYPYLGGGAESQGNLADANRLIGWIDMDHPSIMFPNEVLGVLKSKDLKIRQRENYTEYDYQFLGAWIDDLRGTRPGALQGWLAHLRDPVNNPPPWQPAPSTLP